MTQRPLAVTEVDIIGPKLLRPIIQQVNLRPKKQRPDNTFTRVSLA
jgi:hypothetical protein